MTRRLAVIPARGGSKRIPDKNIREFLGKPIIAYSLEAAKTSTLFSCIHVSTDSEKIRDCVSQLGFPTKFLRPSSLSDDQTPIMPVLKDVVDRYRDRGQNFDEVCLIMACAPLIEPSDLQGAVELFHSRGCAFPVLAVARYPAPVEWAFRRREDGPLIPDQPGMFKWSSQELDPSYYDAGCFAIWSIDQLRSTNQYGSDQNFVGYVLPRHKAIDIDDEEDFLLAEMVYRGARQVG